MGRAVWVCALPVLLCVPEQAAAASGPAPVFRPGFAKPQQSRTPVYVPSWLPHFERTVYPLAYVGPRGRTDEIDLSYVRKSVGTATLAFYLTANVDVLSPGPNAKHVSLAKGVTGLVGSIPHTATDSLTIRWRRNGVVYVIGRLGSEADLIRCARSVVRLAR
jgi:hypothetical protein